MTAHNLRCPVFAVLLALAAIGCARSTGRAPPDADVAAEIAPDSTNSTTAAAEADARTFAPKPDDGKDAFDADWDPAAAPLSCDETPVADTYAKLAFLKGNNCTLCHGSSGPTWMGKPGPTWLFVGDPTATVRHLIHLGFILSPAQSSPFLRVLIPIDEGGIAHTGGKRLHKGDVDWLELLSFVNAAQACLP